MRFAVINDIQGNRVALRAVLNDIEANREGVERIVSTGDLVGVGPEPNDVIDTLREAGIESVMGNYDEAVAWGRTFSGTDFADAEGEDNDALALAWTRRTLTPENIEFLQRLPREMRLNPQYRGIRVERVRDDDSTREYRRTFLLRSLFGGLIRENRRPFPRELRVTVVHGSPRELNEFIREDTAQSLLQAMSRDASADVLISGHARESFQRAWNGVTYIGVGSVNAARAGGGVAAYAVVDVGEQVTAEFHEVRYDPQAHVEAVMESGLPSALADPFRR